MGDAGRSLSSIRLVDDRAHFHDFRCELFFPFLWLDSAVPAAQHKFFEVTNVTIDRPTVRRVQRKQDRTKEWRILYHLPRQWFRACDRERVGGMSWATVLGSLVL